MTALLAGALIGACGTFALIGALADAGSLWWRRKERLARTAMHELRRPLQALALAAPTGGLAGQLALARAALVDLDRALDGLPPAPASPRPVCVRDAVAAAVDRAAPEAERAGGHVRGAWRGDGGWVEADPLRLAQALDNLLSNAVCHGGARIAVSGRSSGGRVRVAIADRGGSPGPGSGQGLGIVRRVAADHGGRFALHRAATGSVAILELPAATKARTASA